MMGTPQNCGDFASGFSLSEGIVRSPDEVETLDIVEFDDGIELRMWLASPQSRARQRTTAAYRGAHRLRHLRHRSIAEAMRPAAVVTSGASFSPREIMAAMASIAPLQTINIETRAVHAAAFWMPGRGIVALREDVGRHNALDKLAGALAQADVSAADGMVLLTSRVSVEMVQKTAAIGAPLMVAVSAPTALAVRTADAAGITLAAIARSDGFEIFTHPGRIASIQNTGVAEPTMSPDRLIYMANQIGKFFQSQGHDKAVPGIADHIKKFWEPGCARRSLRISIAAAPGSIPMSATRWRR